MCGCVLCGSCVVLAADAGSVVSPLSAATPVFVFERVVPNILALVIYLRWPFPVKGFPVVLQ